MEKRIIVFLLFVVLIINMSGLFHALGISSSYYSKKPLIMAPGETREIVFGQFQNLVDDYDMNIGVNLLAGEEIAEIIDKEINGSLEYLVPVGRKDIPVNMNVKIPKKGYEKEYIITIRYSEIDPPVGGGTVSFSSASQKSVKVLVQEEAKEEGVGARVWIIGLILGIIILIIGIIIYVWIKNKKEKDFNN